MSKYIAYHNGYWISSDKVCIAPNDRGLTLGDSVYDALRTFNGKPYQVDEHTDRLFRSLKAVSIDPKITSDAMKKLIVESCSRNNHLIEKAGDHRVYIWISRGVGRWAYNAGPPTVLILVSPLDFGRYAHLYEAGARAVIPDVRSYTINTLDPRIKHTSRMNFNLAEIEANRKDPEAWPVLRDDKGFITESTACNIFLVKEGVIRTPYVEALLRGISRETIFELARQLDLTAKEDNIMPDDLYNADEVFFTGTSMCLLPVTVIDGKPIGNGKPGNITIRLLRKWSENVDMDIIEQAIQFQNA